MAMVIVLSAAEAAAVTGASPIKANAVIQPVPLTDGTFYVGVEVLTDVVFVAAKYQAMKLKPQVDYTTLSALTFKPNYPNRG